ARSDAADHAGWPHYHGCRSAQGHRRPKRSSVRRRVGACDRYAQRDHANLRQQWRHRRHWGHLRRDDPQRRDASSLARQHPVAWLFVQADGKRQRKTRAPDLPHAAHRQGDGNLRAVSATTGGENTATNLIAPVPLLRGNLFLVGLPGAGKSTLGRQLARRLHKRVVDADVELEHRLGVSIPTIFEIEGEAGFRDREEVMIAELTLLEGIVLSTGGGAVLREANRVRLKENGTVIYLHAEPSTLRARVPHSRNRPLLQTADPMGRLSELYAQRDALYRETADHVVESDRSEVMRLARMFDVMSQHHDGI